MSGGASYNGGTGLAAIKQTTNTIYTAPTPVNNTTDITSYFGTEGFDIVSYGNEALTSTGGFTVTLRSVYTPPSRDKRYTLAPGGSVDVVTNQTTTTVIPGLPSPAPTTASSTVRVTYVGQESVTVPAGTFTACKFTELVSGNTSTLWIIKGKGVAARNDSTSSSGTVTLQLQGTSRLNGAAI